MKILAPKRPRFFDSLLTIGHRLPSDGWAFLWACMAIASAKAGWLQGVPL